MTAFDMPTVLGTHGLVTWPHGSSPSRVPICDRSQACPADTGLPSVGSPYTESTQDDPDHVGCAIVDERDRHDAVCERPSVQLP